MKLGKDRFLPVVREIERECGVSTDLAKLYALLVLTNSVSPEGVHDAWALWVCDANPNHAALAEFGELPRDMQERDIFNYLTLCRIKRR